MSGKIIVKQNAMVKSTFFTGQPVFANSASTSTGTKSSRSARNLAENAGDANAKRSESIFGDNNFMPKPANLDDGDVRLSQGRHDAQGEDRFVC